MASGLPVIASENRGHRDIVTEANGVLLQENTAEEFAKAFYNLYKSPEKCKVISKNNLELCKRFDIDAIKVSLLSIIEG